MVLEVILEEVLEAVIVVAEVLEGGEVHPDHREGADEVEVVSAEEEANQFSIAHDLLCRSKSKTTMDCLI